MINPSIAEVEKDDAIYKLVDLKIFGVKLFKYRKLDDIWGVTYEEPAERMTKDQLEKYIEKNMI